MEFEAHTSRDADQILSREEFYRLAAKASVNYPDSEYALVFLRILNMGAFNTLRGIEMGEKILHFVAHRIANTTSAGLTARYSVDSFIFVAPYQMVPRIVQELNAELSTFGTVNGLEAKAGYIMRRHRFSTKGALDRARFACDSIRFEDGVFCQFFADDVELSYDKRSYVAGHLEEAIANHEIRAYAQPIIRLLTGRVCEVECLARWESAKFGFLRPDEFIPVLEHRQLIHKLDAEVFRLACEQWAEARKLGIDVPFGINLSRLDFELCDIYDVITKIMARYEVPIDQVHIEITESAASSNEDVVYRGIMRFATAGFEIYLDDYGSGYSSLAILEKYPFKVIKLDMSLIREVETNERARVIVSDTIGMIKRLGLQALCEGVETAEQLEFLRAVGCEKGQGYLFGKPASHEETMATLAENAQRYEGYETREYLDLVGLVDPISGLSAALQGVEAAHFLGREPIAVLEVSEDQVALLMANVAYRRFLLSFGFADIDDFIKYTTEDNVDAHFSSLEACAKAKETGQETKFSFFIENTYVTVIVSHIASKSDRDAYLHRVESIEVGNYVTDNVLLKGVLNAIDRKIFWKDKDRRFLGANQAFLDYYGFSGLDAIIGKNDEDMGWHVDEEPFKSDELEVLQGKVITRARGTCMCRGVLRDIEASKRPLYSHGKIVGLVGFFEDRGPHMEDWE